MKAVLLFSALIACSLAQFSETARQQIVDAHNTLRSSIAKGTYVANEITKPRGANILKIKWDYSLEASARIYSHSCTDWFSSVSRVGANVYYKWNLIESLDYFVVWGSCCQQMGERVPRFRIGNIYNEEIYKEGDTCSACSSPTKCEEASGLLHNVLFVVCKNDPSKNEMKRCVVVCLYKNRESILHQKIYQQGATCLASPYPAQSWDFTFTDFTEF
ncbi:Protein CBG10401 [Caenorhabditis briggsae]|uniref:Protein CBG10401 n=1 Tax=Caenorhabditis briggsae TaxID=6238 RepID=A8XB44_CAEBR|nr:Protein CBG10401 [Caenorhabditis briggsae]CAP29824.1 Protein CBG10401 [Caenorhabditis briggsae]